MELLLETLQQFGVIAGMLIAGLMVVFVIGVVLALLGPIRESRVGPGTGRRSESWVLTLLLQGASPRDHSTTRALLVLMVCLLLPVYVVMSIEAGALIDIPGGLLVFIGMFWVGHLGATALQSQVEAARAESSAAGGGCEVEDHDNAPRCR